MRNVSDLFSLQQLSCVGMRVGVLPLDSCTTTAPSMMAGPQTVNTFGCHAECCPRYRILPLIPLMSVSSTLPPLSAPSHLVVCCALGFACRTASATRAEHVWPMLPLGVS